MGQTIRWIALALAAAITLSLGGCATATLAASETRVPVLFGPIPCIGCAAAKAPAGSVVGVEGRGSELVVLFPHAWDESDEPGVSIDRVFYGTPCTDDIHLANVHARARQLTVPIFLYWSSASVGADATSAPSPGGTCPAP